MKLSFFYKDSSSEESCSDNDSEYTDYSSNNGINSDSSDNDSEDSKYNIDDSSNDEYNDRSDKINIVNNIDDVNNDENNDSSSDWENTEDDKKTDNNVIRKNSSTKGKDRNNHSWIGERKFRRKNSKKNSAHNSNKDVYCGDDITNSNKEDDKQYVSNTNSSAYGDKNCEGSDGYNNSTLEDGDTVSDKKDVSDNYHEPIVYGEGNDNNGYAKMRVRYKLWSIKSQAESLIRKIDREYSYDVSEEVLIESLYKELSWLTDASEKLQKFNEGVWHWKWRRFWIILLIWDYIITKRNVQLLIWIPFYI